MEKTYIYNLQQAYFYIEHGIKPIEPPREHYTTHKVFFVFNKEDIKNIEQLWKDNK